VYNGAWCVAETLDCVFAQTHKNLEILLSIDKSDDESEKVCREYLTKNDRSAKLFVHDKRLGWVGNCNFLLEMARGDYTCIIPHDDLIEAQYVEKLLAGFVKYPLASNCYPAVITFGTVDSVIEQPSTIGTLEERILNVINYHQNAVSFRGLVKRISERALRLLRTDQLNDMKADSIGILQHAIVGELRYIPDVVYKKRFHEKNTHVTWRGAQRAQKVAMWARHCATLCNIARPYVSDKKSLLETCWRRVAITKNLRSNNLDNSDLSALRVIFRNSLWEERLPTCAFDPSPRRRICVLGAGIQGCCVAMMLKKYNYDVVLIDQSDDIMTRASLNQEGKIHLGLVYTKAQSTQTASKILTSALHFSHYMQYLLEQPVDWTSLKSTPFKYVVAKDSLLDVDAIESIFLKLQEQSKHYLQENPHLSYMGTRFEQMFARSTNFDQTHLIGSFDTAEIAVRQGPLKQMIREKLVTAGVEFYFGNTIEKVQRIGSKFSIETREKGGFECDIVVNCLWESKKFIDEQLGHVDRTRQANMRYKFGIISKEVQELSNESSFTMVQGPFGDFVNFGKESTMYFSWYPNSMRGMVMDNAVPAEWNQWSEHNVPDEIHQDILDGHLVKFRELFSRDFAFVEPRLVGGIIVASGTTDIKDANSKLHDRDEETLFDSGDGYYSIATNKFTNAPHNTMLFERVLQQLYVTHCREPQAKFFSDN